jgi:amino acid transporter
MADKSQSKKPLLKKELTLFALVAISVGAIIGSGLFVLPAIMGSVAGPSFVLAVIGVGIIILILGLVYAELGSTYHMTGGPYSLPRKALGNDTGFVLGWGYFLYAFTGTAAIIEVFILYLGFYVPGLAVGGLSGYLTPLGIGIALIALAIFTLINIFGVKFGAWYSIATTLGKVIPLAIFAIIGFLVFKVANFTPFLPYGIGGLGLAMALDFFAFTGFEAVVIPEGETKKPTKIISKAMIMTILIVIAIYALISLAFTGMINWSNAGIAPGNWTAIGNLSSPLATAALSINIPILAGVIAAIIVIGAIISTAGCGGDWVLLQGRIPFAMAQNNLFWSPMKDVNKKYGTPVKALIFASVLTGITLILLPSFPEVALIASITTLVPYAAATIALPILRKTDPKTKRPFKLYGGTAFALIGFVLSTFLIYWASWPWTLVGALLILIGYVLFLTVKKERKFEFKRNMWLITYMIGIIVISLIGSTTYIFDNFLPIGPLGLLNSPYDLIVLGIFAIIIFAWAYKSNIGYKPLEDDYLNE